MLTFIAWIQSSLLLTIEFCEARKLPHEIERPPTVSSCVRLNHEPGEEQRIRALFLQFAGEISFPISTAARASAIATVKLHLSVSIRMVVAPTSSGAARVQLRRNVSALHRCSANKLSSDRAAASQAFIIIIIIIIVGLIPICLSRAMGDEKRLKQVAARALHRARCNAPSS